MPFLRETLKKGKRKLDLAKRKAWGELNPVTRSPVNSRACNGNKARNWKRDDHEPIPGFLLSMISQIRTASPSALSCFLLQANT